MDDFRRPYEYTEDKRGWLLLFAFMLILVDIFQALIYIVPLNGQLQKTPVLRIGFLFLGALFLLFILITAIACFKLNKNLVTLSKAYLITRAVFMSACIIIIFQLNTNLKDRVGFGKQYTTLSELLLTRLIAPIAFELAYSLIWYLYFSKSKRCKELCSKPTL